MHQSQFWENIWMSTHTSHTCTVNTCKFAGDTHNQSLWGKFLSIYRWKNHESDFPHSLADTFLFSLPKLLFSPHPISASSWHIFSPQGKPKYYLLSEVFWLPTPGKELPFFVNTIVSAVCTIYTYHTQHTFYCLESIIFFKYKCFYTARL